MNVLAIGTLTGKDIEPHLAAEQEHVAKLREEGLIRDVFLKADRTGPILVLANVDAEQAEDSLADLPFLTEELVTFDFVELITIAEAQARSSRACRGPYDD
jgi:hypothetical protein